MNNSNLPITYILNFVSEPNSVLEILKTQLEWERRETAPRCEYYINDFNEPYVYGNGAGRRTYFSRPSHPKIDEIRANLEKQTDSKFEVCFLNRYLNQSDSLGWHSDDSPEMDMLRPIGVVSLGVEREIWFRPKDKLEEITKLKLNNRSLCLMAPGMQKNYQHKIPKASFQCGERISLTFRGYKQLCK